MDRRFAIVIGINDYDINPLNFCAQDAKEIATILHNNCRFPQENIYSIISESASPIKDISGHLDIALGEISSNFRPNIDSIFFYFAGHGQNLNEKSYMAFHDSSVEIRIVLDKISELKPKIQTYVIDACQSGAKVISRNTSPNESLIDNYLKQSSGILLMFAATELQSAFEEVEKQHGIFTYYFLNAINNKSLYDEDKILTPSRIHEYVARQISRDESLEQTPVIESRIIGYYPFAFIESLELEEVRKDVSAENDKDQLSKLYNKIIEQEYFPEVPFEIRRSFFKFIQPVLQEKFEDFILQFEDLGYESSTGINTDIFGYEVSDKVDSDLIYVSKNKEVYGMNGVFNQSREEIKPNPLLGTIGLIGSLMKNNEPSYRDLNYIDYSESNILCYSVNLRSSSIYMVSAGLAIFIYQAVYGIGFAFSSFHYDNKNYKNTNIIGPRTIVKPFKYNVNTNDNITFNFEKSCNSFFRDLCSWNEQRDKEINSFGANAE